MSTFVPGALISQACRAAFVFERISLIRENVPNFFFF